MKHHIYLLFTGFFLSLMLLFPAESFDGASTGLVLWFHTILPTLLPFMICSNILLRTNSIFSLTNFFAPVLGKLFHISPSGCYAVFVGFLCGCPMGAKTIGDLVSHKHISKNEGQYLLSFCNNISPMFISSFLIRHVFQDTTLAIPTMCILMLSPVFCSFLFRTAYINKEMKSPVFFKTKTDFSFEIVDDSIMNSFETITKLGGYIILFSMLFSIGESSIFAPALPVLEITNGLSVLFSYPIPFGIRYVLCLALTSFGGFCTIAQVYSLTHDAGLSIWSYTKEKLITAMVTSLIACLYVLFILE